MPESPLFMWKKPGFLQLFHEINPLKSDGPWARPQRCPRQSYVKSMSRWVFTVPKTGFWMKGTFAGHPYSFLKRRGGLWWFMVVTYPAKLGEMASASGAKQLEALQDLRAAKRAEASARQDFNAMTAGNCWRLVLQRSQRSTIIPALPTSKWTRPCQIVINCFMFHFTKLLS